MGSDVTPAVGTGVFGLIIPDDTWTIETGDRGAIPEPPEIVAPFLKEMEDWFGTPEWYAAERE